MATIKETPILIIGAGPAGLAIAGRLRMAQISFEIIEKSDAIASSWHGHYDRLHLHTVKQFSHLPGMDFPEHYPLYVPKKMLIEYYELYAQQFDIKPVFQQEVVSMTRQAETWVISCKNGDVWKAQIAVIATGSNNIPNRPLLPGESDYSGMMVHSRLYKNPLPFKDKKVLVVGMGNTGAEIALDLAEAGIETTISVRGPVNVVPRDVLGKPVQLTAKKLEKLPFGLGTLIGDIARKIVIGDLSKYGIPKSTMNPAKQLKETGKTPVIDLGTINMIRKGKIQVVGDLLRLTTDGVELKSGEKRIFDAIILATGYQTGLMALMPSLVKELDAYGFPKNAIAAAQEHDALYFVGFDNYKIGGLLGSIQHDSKTVVDHIISARSKS